VKGWVYVYVRKSDWVMLNDHNIDEILLYKIGMSKNDPEKRVADQARTNREAYVILEKYST